MSLPWKLAPAVPSVGTSTARGVDARLARLVERLADRGDLRVGEGDPRRADPFGDRLDLAAEQVLGRDPGLVLAHVGEERPAVDVADRVEPLAPADPQAVVGLEEAVLAGLDPGRLEPEVARCGARGRPRSGSPPPRPGRRRRGRPTTPGAAGRDLLGLDAGADVDAEALAQRARRLPRRRTAPRARAGARRPRPASPSSPSDAQAWESSHADRAAAEHDHALRHPLGGGRLAVVPGLDRVEPVDRRHRGAAAGGDDDGASARSASSSPTTHPALAVEPALAAEEVDPALFEPGQLAGVVEVVDHLVAAVEHRLRVELAAHRLGDAGDPLAPRRARRPGRSSAFEGMQA